MERIALALLSIVFMSCNSSKKGENAQETYPRVQITGAMKNVMMKGELGGNISLDTIVKRKGLYGLGPVSFLRGEILILDGEIFVSSVTSDSTMSVKRTSQISAPFFVHSNVNAWKEITLPYKIKNIKDLEKFINENSQNVKLPFAFKLIGKVKTADMHVVNLPDGAKVSSPEEAHQGQVNYNIKDENVEIIGFFSKDHKGVFTHHDSFLHMHLITRNQNKMGHLDNAEFAEMKLYIPGK